MNLVLIFRPFLVMKQVMKQVMKCQLFWVFGIIGEEEFLMIPSDVRATLLLLQGGLGTTLPAIRGNSSDQTCNILRLKLRIVCLFSLIG